MSSFLLKAEHIHMGEEKKNSENYRIVDNLYNLLIKEISSILTIERKNESLEPFTNQQINDFIVQHKKTIYKIIDAMIIESIRNTKLDINNPIRDWLRDGLFNDIEILNDLLEE